MREKVCPVCDGQSKIEDINDLCDECNGLTAIQLICKCKENEIRKSGNLFMCMKNENNEYLDIMPIKIMSIVYTRNPNSKLTLTCESALDRKSDKLHA